MTMNLFHSLWTVVVLVTFIGIIVWSYSKNRKSDFDAAANLALEDHFPIVAHDVKKQEESNV